jgi:hypothetical protein
MILAWPEDDSGWAWLKPIKRPIQTNGFEVTAVSEAKRAKQYRLNAVRFPERLLKVRLKTG